VITRGTPARSAVGYEIWGSTRDACRRLRAAGYDVERAAISGGHADVLVLVEPSTGVPLHLYESQELSAPRATPAAAHKLATWRRSPRTGRHTEVLRGAPRFKWSDTIGDFFVFLRCNADHHAANFLPATNTTVCTTSPTRCVTLRT